MRNMVDAPQDPTHLGVSMIGKRKLPTTHNEDDEVEQTVARVLDLMIKDSIFFAENLPRELPSFAQDEMKLGCLLGAGEFGAVRQIDSFQRQVGGCGCQTACGGKPSSALEEPPEEATIPTKPLDFEISAPLEPATQQFDSKTDFDDDVSDLDENEEDGEVDYLRDYLINHVYRCGQFRYAMKRIKKDLKRDKLVAVMDMACEAKIMSSLSHPNIVKIRATMGIPGRPNNFGIILDRLNETLQQKIYQWTIREKQASGKALQRWLRKKSAQWNGLFLERLWAVYDIARAMRYLKEKKYVQFLPPHKPARIRIPFLTRWSANRILFRDLKPENVGVNLRGDYLIFDFGLAKELKRGDLVEPPDGFEATGLTGSRRYMAPEVVNCKNYGFSADVYSFAILFWETMSLKTPYHNMTFNQHYERVVLNEKRPNRLNSVLPKKLQAMMLASWSPDPLNRPNMKYICEQLFSEISIRKEIGTTDVEERTKYLLDKSHVSRDGSVKDCC